MINREIIKSKRGDSEVLMPVVVSVVVMLFFFSLIFLGASDVAKGVAFYEKTYAQQIGLLIEKASPYSEISIDFKRGFEIAKKQGRNINELVKIDKKNNGVLVSLSNRGGYFMRIPYEYDIRFIPLPNENKMKIIILK